MASKLGIYPVFVGRTQNLHAAAIASIFADRFLKGDSDIITRPELAKDIGGADEITYGLALLTLFEKQMIGIQSPDGSPVKISDLSSFRVAGVRFILEPVQAPLPFDQSPAKASREELCYDEFRSTSGARYSFTLAGVATLTQKWDIFEDASDLLTHEFADAAQAWAWWDEFDRANRIVPAVTDWLRSLEPATVSVGCETWDILGRYLEGYDGSQLDWMSAFEDDDEDKDIVRYDLEFHDEHGELIRRMSVFPPIKDEDIYHYSGLDAILPELPVAVEAIPADGDVAAQEPEEGEPDPVLARAELAEETGHPQIADMIRADVDKALEPLTA